jgi:hypothetical protein
MGTGDSGLERRNSQYLNTRRLHPSHLADYRTIAAFLQWWTLKRPEFFIGHLRTRAAPLRTIPQRTTPRARKQRVSHVSVSDINI